MKKYIKMILGLVLAISVIGFFVYAREYISIEYILEKKDFLSELYNIYPLYTLIVFVLVYVILVTISFPGAVFLTLLGGLLFGAFVGIVVSSIASAIGATIAIILTRFVFKDIVKKYFGNKLDKILSNIDNNEVQYLFALRLAPVFPFFLVNLAMAFTNMNLLRYFLVTIVGSFPATVIYVYAGSQLANIQTLDDIISVEVFSALFLLALFPFVIKYIFKNKRWYNKSINNEVDLYE